MKSRKGLFFCLRPRVSVQSGHARNKQASIPKWLSMWIIPRDRHVRVQTTPNSTTMNLIYSIYSTSTIL